MFTNLRSAATGSTAASILSKLKSDFGITTATNEKANLSSTNLAGTLTAPVTRVISLPLPAQAPVTQKASVADPTLFLDLTQALKESIIGALDDIVREREDAVRKGEASMRIPGGSGGWNWNKFFACKESLALTYERMSLFEDALLTYDELEASMAQVARGQSVVLRSLFSARSDGTYRPQIPRSSWVGRARKGLRRTLRRCFRPQTLREIAPHLHHQRTRYTSTTCICSAGRSRSSSTAMKWE